AVEFQPGIEPGIGRSDCTIPRAYSDTIVSSSLPLHPAIRQPSWLERAFTAIDPVALVVIVLFVGGLVVLLQLARRSSRTWQRRLRRLIRRQTPLIIFLVFIGSMAMITLATYMVEKKYNENFSTLIESWWSITLYLLSGLEDRVPYTPLGRLFATIGLVAGPTFFAFLTSWLTKSFIIRERNMPSRMRDHILLLNWTDRAAELIEELKDSREHTKEKYEILVLGDQTSLDSLDSRRVIQDRREIAFEGFFFLLGDPTDQEALRQAKADSAHTVLILADDRLDVAADERTIRSIIMLRRLAQENNETIHVVAEVVNPANHAILEDLADGFPGLLEPITGLKVRACLLAQAALNKGVVSFYEDLLRTSGETNEIYISPLPFDVAGTPFREYAARVIADAPLPVIPVGVQRNYNGRAEIFCNPRDGQPGSILRIGDCLVMIAFEPVEEDILPSGRLREGNVE
ncbi:MAG: NAD-binding protein, partial [Verrucomicrobiota bacterium]